VVIIGQDGKNQLELCFRLRVTGEELDRIVQVTQRGQHRVQGGELENGRWIERIPK
jgi:hypothetical protein